MEVTLTELSSIGSDVTATSLHHRLAVIQADRRSRRELIEAARQVLPANTLFLGRTELGQIAAFAAGKRKAEKVRARQDKTMRATPIIPPVPSPASQRPTENLEEDIEQAKAALAKFEALLATLLETSVAFDVADATCEEAAAKVEETRDHLESVREQRRTAREVFRQSEIRLKEIDLLQLDESGLRRAGEDAQIAQREAREKDSRAFAALQSADPDIIGIRSFDDIEVAAEEATEEYEQATDLVEAIHRELDARVNGREVPLLAFEDAPELRSQTASLRAAIDDSEARARIAMRDADIAVAEAVDARQAATTVRSIALRSVEAALPSPISNPAPNGETLDFEGRVEEHLCALRDEVEVLAEVRAGPPTAEVLAGFGILLGIHASEPGPVVLDDPLSADDGGQLDETLPLVVQMSGLAQVIYLTNEAHILNWAASLPSDIGGVSAASSANHPTVAQAIPAAC